MNRVYLGIKIGYMRGYMVEYLMDQYSSVLDCRGSVGGLSLTFVKESGYLFPVFALSQDN